MFTHIMQITHKQKEIIEACGRILTEKGLTALTVKNLATEMGFVESALYRHFKSKEDIILMLIKYLHTNMQERLMPIAMANIAPREKLSLIFDSQFTYISQHKYFVVTILSEGIPDDSPKIKATLQELFIFKFGLITEIINKILNDQKTTRGIESESFVYFLLGGFRVLLLQWKFSGFSMDLKEKGHKLIKDFLLLINSNDVI